MDKAMKIKKRVRLNRNFIEDYGFNKIDDFTYELGNFKVELNMLDFTIIFYDVCLRNDFLFCDELEDIYFLLTKEKLKNINDK